MHASDYDRGPTEQLEWWLLCTRFRMGSQDYRLANEWIEEAERRRTNGEVVAAIALYREAAAAVGGMPGSNSVYFNLAGCLEEIGEIEEAITWLERALQFEPADADALFNAGFFSCRLKRFADGIGYFERYLALEPGDTTVRRALAQARSNLGASSSKPGPAPAKSPSLEPTAEIDADSAEWSADDRSVLIELRMLADYDESMRQTEELMRQSGIPSHFGTARRNPYRNLILPSLFMLLDARQQNRTDDYDAIIALARRAIGKLPALGAHPSQILRCTVAVEYIDLNFAPRAQPAGQHRLNLFWESTKPLRESGDPDPVLGLAVAYGRLVEAISVVEATTRHGVPRRDALAMNRLKFLRAETAFRGAMDSAPKEWIATAARWHLSQLAKFLSG